MFDNHQIGKYSSVIAFNFVFLIFSNLSLNAQSNPSEYSFLKDIKVEKDLNWSFSSENESISVKDEIKELKEYSISESNSLDVQLIKENRRWDNRGNPRDYSVEAEFYNY